MPELNEVTGEWEFVMFGKIQSYQDYETAMDYWMLFQNWMFSDCDDKE